MDILIIILTAFLLFLFFITPSVMRRFYDRKRYEQMLKRYRMDEERIEREKPSNVYNIEEYRNRKKEKMGDDVFEYSNTHNLVWSEESEKYVRTPKNIPIEDK